METSQSLLELVAAAQASAKVSEHRILNILQHMDNEDGSHAQVEELRAEIVKLKLVSVNTFSLFEARMQHNFRRGPFSRKLKSLLLESKKVDLADRVHNYYLAINVLKHGKGSSYRELLNVPNSYFILKPNENKTPVEEHATACLIDVSAPGFFDGLCATIIEAYHFLENR